MRGGGYFAFLPKTAEIGQAIVEYVILLSLVSILVIGSLQALGGQVDGKLSQLRNGIELAGESGSGGTGEMVHCQFTASSFKVDDLTEFTTADFLLEVGTTHTITYTDTDQFLYWRFDDSTVASTGKQYTFTVTGAFNLTAVSANHEFYDNPVVTVIVLGESNQVLSNGVCADIYDVNYAMPWNTPQKPGYTFTGWIIEEYGIEATASNIMSYASTSNPVLHIIPTFAAN